MKKFLSIILLMGVVLSVAPAVISAAPGGWPPPFYFSDVSEDAWYYDSVRKCYNNGVVNGMGGDMFSPDSILTRAQFVMMLAAMPESGYAPDIAPDGGFEDVKDHHWYYDAVCWAKDKGLVSGMTETNFAPNVAVTREQAVRMLFLYISGFDSWEIDKDISAELSAFDDVGTVSDWALEGMHWAVGAGIISGMTDNTLVPGGTATRAQACRMMSQMLDYIIYGGVRDTDGVFKVISDYIIESSDGANSNAVYTYTSTTDESKLEASYDRVENIITIEVCTQPTKVAHNIIEYGDRCILSIHGMSDSYELVYMSSDVYTGIYGHVTMTLTKDGYVIEGFDVSEEDKIRIEENAKASASKFLNRFEILLSECDLAFADMFA